MANPGRLMSTQSQFLVLTVLLFGVLYLRGGSIDGDSWIAHQTADVKTKVVLVGLISLCTLLQLVQRVCKSRIPSSPSTDLAGNSDDAFMTFVKRYLPAYLCGTFADWMLGPYVYAVYESYGYDVQDISLLYIVGFASSLLLGTLAGPLIDKNGRKRGALAYCVVMIVSSVCVNSGSFFMLGTGRVLGGLGTSLLYTTFESWAVSAFEKAGLAPEERSRLFSIATFGNAMCAIVAGLVANELAERSGPVAPFNGASVVLVVCACIVGFSWDENYGDSSNAVSAAISDSMAGILADSRVFLAGLVTAVYEAVLYVFVFIWTPSLQQRAGHDMVPLGLVFASYMVAKMCGATVFELIEPNFSPTNSLRLVLFASCAAFVVPVLWDGFLLTLIGQCGFEFAVGMYWPAIYTFRSVAIAEEIRSTTLGLFRVPLNLIVCICLSRIGDIPDSFVYFSCALVLGLAAILMLAVESYSTGSTSNRIMKAGRSPPPKKFQRRLSGNAGTTSPILNINELDLDTELGASPRH